MQVTATHEALFKRTGFTSEQKAALARIWHMHTMRRHSQDRAFQDALNTLAAVPSLSSLQPPTRLLQALETLRATSMTPSNLHLAAHGNASTLAHASCMHEALPILHRDGSVKTGSQGRHSSGRCDNNSTHNSQVQRTAAARSHRRVCSDSVTSCDSTLQEGQKHTQHVSSSVLLWSEICKRQAQQHPQKQALLKKSQSQPLPAACTQHAQVTTSGYGGVLDLETQRQLLSGNVGKRKELWGLEEGEQPQSHKHHCSKQGHVFYSLDMADLAKVHSSL